MLPYTSIMPRAIEELVTVKVDSSIMFGENDGDLHDVRDVRDKTSYAHPVPNHSSSHSSVSNEL